VGRIFKGWDKLLPDRGGIGRMISILIGTKGQLIKTSPMLIEMERRGIPYEFVLLGQHGDIIRSLIQLFDLREPDMAAGGREDVTGMASGIRWSVASSRRLLSSIGVLGGDTFLVHGDPLSALQGALLAKLSGRKLVHLEAGLRSGTLREPFPEESVRISVDAMSDFLIAPTREAVGNLSGSGGRVLLSEGNTGYDSVQLAVRNGFPEGGDPYVVATLHRFENIMVPWRLKRSIEAILLAAGKHRVVFPLHPSTKRRIRGGLLSRLQAEENVDISPLRRDYFSFINLIRGAEYVITDGGGLQEETYYLGVPCLLLRGVTERPEGLGSTCVVSRNRMAVIREFLDSYGDFRAEPARLSKSPSALAVDVLREEGLLEP